MYIKLTCLVAAILAIAGSSQTGSPESLVVSAAQALDRGDAVTGARLAIAALPDADTRAEALLLEAIMAQRPVVFETGQTPFPRYHGKSDVIPDHAVMAADGSKIMILNSESTEDLDTTDLYELPSGRLLSRQLMPTWRHLSRSPDLATLAAFDQDQVTLKDTVSGDTLFSITLAEPYMYSWQVTDDRTRLTAIGDDVLHIWNPVTGTHGTQTFPKNSVRDRAYLSPDGRFLAAEPKWKPANDFFKYIWDIGSHTVKITLTDNGPIRAAFTQDSRYLVSSEISGPSRDYGWDWEVQVWDLEAFQPVGKPVTLKDVGQAHRLGETHLIAFTLYDSIRIFDLRTQRVVGAPGAISTFAHPGWRDEGPVTIDGRHVVHTYRLDARLSMDAAALVIEACRLWGAVEQLRPTSAEAVTYGLKEANNPCETTG